MSSTPTASFNVSLEGADTIDGRNDLCVTTDILSEYFEILERKASARFASLVLEVILNNPHTRYINTFYRFNLISADPDDNKFVDCAIASQARFIVTDDHHYDVLKNVEFPQVDIVSIDQMLLMV